MNLEAVDQALGSKLERTLIAHHRRRLARIGRLDALDAPPGGWAAGDPSPRAGNDVEAFVAGSPALPAIAHAVESARSHAGLAGWHFSPELWHPEARPTPR